MKRKLIVNNQNILQKLNFLSLYTLIFNLSLYTLIFNYIQNNNFMKQLIYTINKILSIRLNIYKIYFTIILFLPFIQTNLRLRFGAGWQLYIPLIFLLYFIILLKRKDFYNYFVLITISIIFILVSDFYGLYLYRDFSLSSNLLHQIKSLGARISVETIRFLSSIIFFFLTIYLIKNITMLQKSLKYFLYTSLFQAIYGFYEFISKVFFHFLPLLNSKAYSHGTYRIFGTFYEPSQYGQFMLISILVLILYKSLTTVVIKNYQYDFFIKNYKKILFFMLIMLFFSFSRAAMLSGMIVIFVYSILSMKNIKRIFQIFGFIFILALSFFIFIKINLTEKELDAWIYLLTSDTGNGAIARINGVFYNLYLSWVFLVNNFLGIGQGSIIIKFGMLPMFPRLLIENGVFIGLAYIVFLMNLILNTRNLSIKRLRINFYILIVGLIMIQMNYSSDNDPWIWFLLAIIFKSKYILNNYIRNENSRCKN